MSIKDWDLTALREELAAAAARVQRAKRGIDTTGMARPPRDPIEVRWLAARGALGVGESSPAAAESPPRRGPSTR